MKLITKEIEEKFKQYPIGSQDGLGGKAKVIVKFFNPAGAGTWLITEGNKLENGDYEMFGYCDLGDSNCAEFGYVMLSDLEKLKLPFGLKIERDMYLSNNCDLIQAMKVTGLKPPSYMLEDYKKNNFPLIKKYILEKEEVEKFFTSFSLEQLQEFEETLHLYYETNDIDYDKDAIGLYSKSNKNFNSNIIYLSEGTITLDDFLNDYKENLEQNEVENENEIDYI